jgi:hypothetical protein
MKAASPVFASPIIIIIYYFKEEPWPHGQGSFALFSSS